MEEKTLIFTVDNPDGVSEEIFGTLESVEGEGPLFLFRLAENPQQFTHAMVVARPPDREAGENEWMLELVSFLDTSDEVFFRAAADLVRGAADADVPPLQ